MSGVVLLRPGGGGGSSVTISTINGQPIPTFEDTTRGKQLSVADQPLTWSEMSLDHLDWLDIGAARDAESGYLADLDGTIVAAVGQCEDANANTKEIHVYINGTDQGSLGSLGPGANAAFINNTVNIDFNRGDLIRLRAHNGSGGLIQDTVVKLTMKWRA
jgi:hypothetical protein